MSRLVEQLRSLTEGSIGAADRVVAVVRAVTGEHPLALVARDTSADQIWRLVSVFAGRDGELELGGTLFRSEPAATPLHPLLAQACKTSFEPSAFTVCDGAGIDSVAESGSSLLVVPLIQDGVPQAALLIPGAAVDGLAEWELQRLWLAANLAATTLDRRFGMQQLSKLEAQRRREMSEVARIQTRLLPSDQHEIRGAEIAAKLDPCEIAGGDYYDYMPLTHHYREPGTPTNFDVFGVMIADVTGHGVAAAVEAAMFDAILRTYGDEAGPQLVLTYANRHFFSRQGRSHLITAFSSVIDLESETLVYANAGHPPPLLKRSDSAGSVEWLDGSDGIPIGVLPDFEWPSASCRFSPGDTLVLYTDGVIEAASDSGEQFGADRLLRVVEAGPSGAAELLDAIRTAIAQFRGAAPPRDDTTLIVVRSGASRRPPGSANAAR